MENMPLTSQYTHLPASAIANEVNQQLLQKEAVVITAPPGAGKSTLLPLTILKGYVESQATEGRKILMLEPRRVAARHIATRMAEMLGESVGESIGYRVRFESKVSARTRIEVLTEGILTRMLIDDATLDGVSVVIFDEFHERSINSDLALALTRRTHEVIRPDLKIVIMSATIDATFICDALHAALINCEGTMFPVNICYSEKETTAHDMATAAASAAIEAYEKREGDILVFLPGQSDIKRCMNMIDKSPCHAHAIPLYGSLPAERQQFAIAPSPTGERKIVVATPIAETSITIEGVRVVIDSGLCKLPVFDTRTGLTRLETQRISLDMATQRMGRAGRVAEGTCLRLWPRQTEHLMHERRRPEIADADLAPLLLSVAAFGESDLATLSWLTPPPAQNVWKAKTLLLSLGAIDTDGNITPMGRRIATLPCHPRIAKMLLSATPGAMKCLACDIAAILEEKDPMAEQESTDISTRISMLRLARGENALGQWRQTERVAAEYRRITHTHIDNADIAPKEVGRLIAYAYPERIAHSIDNIGGYRLSNGDVVRLSHDDTTSSHPWIAIASLYADRNTAGRVFLAAPVDVDDLDKQLISHVNNVTWDSKRGCVVARNERRVGCLTIDSQPIHDIDQALVADIVCEAMKKYGLSMMPWNDDKLKRLQRRVAQAAAWHPELSIPDISTRHLLDTAKEWLPAYLDDGGRTRTTSTDLQRLNLAQIVWSLIPYETGIEINRIAPTHIKVPTGSLISVDYRDGAEDPIVSVRLQECFGMTETPRLDDGRRPVLMELLSPGFKPVQLTRDLASFWSSTYFEVRKELRRRYPKHYWPENPLEAEAVRGVKKR